MDMPLPEAMFPVVKPIHQNNSALSRANRTQWDWSNPPSGPQEPYKHHEYPKHVYCDPDADPNIT
jgi:hypothetical protein